MSTTTNLALPYIAGSQDAAITKHGEGLFALDVLVQTAVIDRDLTSPPLAATGDVYIPAASSTDDWTGLDGDIVAWDGSSWKSYAPKEGWTVWVKDENLVLRHDGTSWKTLSGAAMFGAYDSAGAQSVTGSQLQIQWGTQFKIDSAVFGHSTSSNPDQITLKEAGWYEVAYTVAVDVSATAGINRIDSRATLNGTLIAGSEVSADNSFGVINRSVASTTFLVNAAANDILRIETTRASGTGTNATRQNCSKVVVRRI